MKSRIVGWALTAVACAPLAAHAQQIQFFASVVDSTGKAVPGVTLDDLSVSENGRPWTIARVDPVEWPTKVVLLVDNGNGMRASIGDLRVGLKAFIGKMPADVEVTLQTTAPQARTVQKATTDKGALLGAVDLIAPDDGAARFADSLFEAAESFDGEGAMARGGIFPVVVIVGTTGADGSQFNEYHVKRMMERFHKQSATVHVVMLYTGIVGVGENQTNIGIGTTQLTGGRYEGINSANRLRTLLPEIGAQIARTRALQEHQYLVTVERPKGDTGPIGQLRIRSNAGHRVGLSPDGRYVQ